MKPRTQPINRVRPGFTLIELLTVIAVIAILTGMLMPAFGTARASVRRNSCSTNLKSILQALQMYKDDWKVFPEALHGVSPDGVLYEPRLFSPDYVRTESIFTCPSAPNSLSDQRLIPAYSPAVDDLTSYALPAFSSYDLQYPSPLSTAGTPSLHYSLKWTPIPRGIADNPRQLIYRNPPDNTVVTWCRYHARGTANGPDPNEMALIAYLSGRVQTVAISRLPGWPAPSAWLMLPDQ